uniref:Uncharacterized protein n=1 Tax=Anguilla anguilla TaxID=7936 RepID=A0A0E9ULL3_ANGAN
MFSAAAVFPVARACAGSYQLQLLR